MEQHRSAPTGSEVPTDKIPLCSAGARASSAQIKAASGEDGNATNGALIPGFRLRREGTFRPYLPGTLLTLITAGES